jgi:hypothetical protein
MIQKKENQNIGKDKDFNMDYLDLIDVNNISYRSDVYGI